jgi:cellulose synthase/poly-beta-1,6-N-acetylglucosamine synthase-like glycosyltransferase
VKQQRTIGWWLFWGSLGLMLYTYLGFPLLLALRAWLRPRAVKRDEITPSVSMIIAAYNEASVIAKKLDNALSLDYPQDKLEIIIASDGSDDGTNDIVANYGSPQVRLIALPRQGKNRTLNASVPTARGEILVFSDADSMLAPDALRQLVASFADPEVGGVGGDYRYPTDVAEGAGERSYWDVDRITKQFQSRGGSMTSATGQIYAVRRALWQPVALSVTDDFFTSVRVLAAHKRLVFEPGAVAFGPIAESSDAEFQRKVRVTTRGLNAVWLSRHLLNPFEYGFYSLQLLTHKVLRRLMGVPFFIVALSAPTLWRRGWLYKLATISQTGLHGAALLGYLLRGTKLGRLKLLSLPFFLDMVNVAALVALVRLLRGERRDVWTPQRSDAAPSQNGTVQPDEVAASIPV